MKFCRYRDPGKTPNPGSYRDCHRDPGWILRVSCPTKRDYFRNFTVKSIKLASCILYIWFKKCNLFCQRAPVCILELQFLIIAKHLARRKRPGAIFGRAGLTLCGRSRKLDKIWLGHFVEGNFVFERLISHIIITYQA